MVQVTGAGHGETFYTILEAKVLIERWRRHYNGERPHSALGYLAPAEFAVSQGQVGQTG